MSCCRRRVPTPSSSATFCSTLGMATPATLVFASNGAQLRLKLSTGTLVEAKSALAQHGCVETSLGARLVSQTYSLIGKVTQQQLTALTGKSMPLLTIRQRLLDLVEKCGSCGGRGCSTCNQMGFT